MRSETVGNEQLLEHNKTADEILKRHHDKMIAQYGKEGWRKKQETYCRTGRKFTVLKHNIHQTNRGRCCGRRTCRVVDRACGTGSNCRRVQPQPAIPE